MISQIEDPTRDAARAPTSAPPGAIPVAAVSAAARRTTRLLGALALAGAVALPLLRQRGAPSWNTIWGEDGWVYFQQAHDHGLSVLLRGYAGYLQLAPRVLAVPSVLVPVHDLTRYFAVAAALVGAMLAWFVYWATEGWVDSRGVRVALASLVVLAPALGYENTANVTNTIWILLAVAPWALVARSDGRRAVLLRGLVAFASATATALSVVFLPLALGYACVRRRRPTWVVCGSYCAGLALQFAVVIHTRDTRPHHSIRQVSALPQIIGVKVFGQFLVGDRGIRALWDHRTALAVLAPLVFVVVAVALLRGLRPAKQALAASFVGLAVVSFVVPSWGRGTNQVALALTGRSQFGPALAGTYNPMSARYGVAPVLLLAGAIAIGAGATRPGRARLARALRTGFVVWVIAVTAFGFSVVSPRSAGPAWTAAVDGVRHTLCANRPAGTRVRIPVPNPTVNPPVVLTCGELGR